MRLQQQLNWLPFLLFLQLFSLQISYGQCDLSNLDLDVSVCNEADNVNITINFQHEGEGNQGFTVLGNGTNYGNFQYSSLPITLSNIEGDCDLVYEFIIRDIQDPTCSIFTELGTICCGESCMLAINSFTTTECEDDTFNVTLSATSNDDIDSLDVFVNAQFFSTIPYSQDSIFIEGVNSDLIDENSITICSAINSECCASYTFLNPCECSISNITTQIIECDPIDSFYNVIIDFEHVANTDSFQMGYSDGGNNNFLGVFAYTDLPVTAGPIFWSDNEREIFIVDTEDFFCFNAAFLGVVNDCSIDCQIFNVFAEAYNCENGQYFVDVEFDTEDIEGSTFDVIIDDVNYGTYEYGENFYTVGPINQNCDEAPILEIQDTNLAFCKDFFNFDDPICCSVPCEFQVFEASVECNDAEEVIITFNYVNTSLNDENQVFVSFGNQEFGPYSGPSGTESILISPIADGTYDLNIHVAGNSSCSETTSCIVSCFAEECTISNILVEAHECEDGLFFVDIEFEGTGVSDSFQIIGNGISYGLFAYGQDFYTFGPLEGDCITTYEFIIQDNQVQDCNGGFDLSEPICCSSCEYTALDIGILDCTDDYYSISIALDFMDTGDTFILAYLDTVIINTYDNFPSEIQELPIGEEILITITSASDSSCSISTTAILESCYDSVEDHFFSNVNIYQNDTEITLNNTANTSYHYFLSSINGKSLSKGDLLANSMKEIPIRGIPTGVYFITLYNNNRLESKKLVIIR